MEKEDKMMSGRQATFMVYEFMKTNAKAGALFDLNDLMAIRLKGDKLEVFWSAREATLTGMKRMPEVDTIETLLMKQIKYSDSMKIEIAHYERHPEGHPDHTYRFLTEAIQRIINKRRQDSNRKEIELLLAGGGAALAAKGKGKGKSKGKGKYHEGEDNDGDGDDTAMPAKGKGKGKDRSGSRGKGKGKGKGKRSQSSKGKGKGKSRGRSNSPAGGKGSGICFYFSKGTCTRGKDCPYSHEAQANAAPAEGKAEAKPKAKPKAKAAAAIALPAVLRTILTAASVLSAGAQACAAPIASVSFGKNKHCFHSGLWMDGAIASNFTRPFLHKSLYLHRRLRRRWKDSGSQSSYA